MKIKNSIMESFNVSMSEKMHRFARLLALAALLACGMGSAWADTYYVITYSSGGQQFLKYNSTTTITSTTTFDAATCIWALDASGNLYITVGGRKYYLNGTSNTALGLTTTAGNNTKWTINAGNNRVYNRGRYRYVRYSGGAWALSSSTQSCGNQMTETTVADAYPNANPLTAITPAQASLFLGDQATFTVTAATPTCTPAHTRLSWTYNGTTYTGYLYNNAITGAAPDAVSLNTVTYAWSMTSSSHFSLGSSTTRTNTVACNAYSEDAPEATVSVTATFSNGAYRQTSNTLTARVRPAALTRTAVTPAATTPVNTALLTALSPNPGTTQLQSSVRFAVTGSASALLNVTRPAYETYTYTKPNSTTGTAYRYTTDGSDYTYAASAPASGSYPALQMTLTPTAYQWNLHEGAADGAMRCLVLNSLSAPAGTPESQPTTRTATTADSRVDVYQWAIASASGSAELAVSADYTCTDDLGQTYTLHTDSVRATVNVTAFPEVRPLPDDNTGSYPVVRLENYRGGYLAASGNQAGAFAYSAGEGDVVTAAAADPTEARYHWYFLEAASDYYVVNMATREYLYWETDVASTAYSVRVVPASEFDGSAHYKWNTAAVAYGGETFHRLYPATQDADGYCMAPAAAGSSDNVRVATPATLGADQTFTLWRVSTATAAFTPAVISDVAIQGSDVVTATGAHAYTATATITPIYYRLEGKYYIYNGVSTEWERTPAVSARTYTTADPRTSVLFDWDFASLSTPGVASVANDAGLNTATLTYPALQDYETATLRVTVGLHATSQTATATKDLILDGNTSATAIAVEPASQTAGTGNPFTLTYTLTPYYAYDRVTVTSSNQLVVPDGAAPFSGGTINLTAGTVTGTATLTIRAYAHDNSAVAATTTARVTTLGACSAPTITPDYHADQVTLANLGDNDICYTLDGTDPNPASSATLASGERISVTSVADGGEVKAMAFDRTGTNANSVVVTYTVNRYETITTDLDHLTGLMTVTNPNYASDATTRVRYDINTEPTYTTGQEVAPAGTTGQVDFSDVVMNTQYMARVYGDNKFPSARYNYTAERFITPFLTNYTPRTSSSNGSAVIYSDATSCLYVNFSITSAGQLVDPDPTDPSTYDVKVASGSSLASIPTETFKAVAFDCDPASPTRILSPVATFTSTYTGFWAIRGEDNGTYYYLSADADGSLQVVSQFDYSCCWSRTNAHKLYVSNGGKKYYLTSNGSALSVTTNATKANEWMMQGHDLYNRYLGAEGYVGSKATFQTASHTFSVAPSAVGSNTVRFDVQTEPLAAGNVEEYSNLKLDSIASTHVATVADGYTHHPYRQWVALDEAGESYTFSIAASLDKRTYIYPACTHYFFTDDGGQDHEFFYYARRSYAHRNETPCTYNDTKVNSGSSPFTYAWTVTGDAASCLTDASGSAATFTATRNSSAVAAPKHADLQVTVSYGTAPNTIAAVSNKVTLFAETRAALTMEDGESFTSGRLFYLANMANPEYRLSVETAATDGIADYATLAAAHDGTRGWLVSQSGPYYILHNNALGKDLWWNSDTAYRTNSAAAYIAPSGATDNDQFILQAYNNGSGTYFTLQPRMLTDNGNKPYRTYSLAPERLNVDSDNGLRLFNADRSWNLAYSTGHDVTYFETDSSAFRHTRWVLTYPTLPVCEIAMDTVGVVTLTDHFCDDQHLDYIIYYKIDDEATWHAYDPDHKPVLAEGQTIKTYTAGVGASSYMHPSPESETFVCRKTSVPTYTIEGVNITFNNTFADDVEIYYTTNGNTPSSNNGSILYTDPEDFLDNGSTLSYIAYSPNCLKSDITTFSYAAQLQLSLTYTGIDPFTIEASVSNSGALEGSHYRIYYTTDGTTPTNESSLYGGPFAIAGYNMIRAKAISHAPGYTDSEVETIIVGSRLYVFSFVGAGGAPSDTNFLKVNPDGSISNTNLLDSCCLFLGPQTPNVSGDIFYNAATDRFLRDADDHVTVTSTTDGGLATRWNLTGHLLRDHSGDYCLAYNEAADSWRIAADGVSGNSYSLAYKADTVSVVASNTITVTPDDMRLDLVAPNEWDANLQAENGRLFPMEGNWAAMKQGDVFDFVAAPEVTVDTAIVPNHTDYRIYSDEAGSALWQTWHYLRDGRAFHGSADEIGERHTAVHAQADANTAITWKWGGATLSNATGSLNSYFTYAKRGTYGDTLRITRTATAAADVVTDGQLSATATYTAGSDQADLETLVGYVYAETEDGSASLTTGSYKVTSLFDGSYILADTTAEVEHTYLGGTPVVKTGTDYTRNAVWVLTTGTNAYDGHAVCRGYNYGTNDTLAWNSLNAGGDTSLYIVDHTLLPMRSYSYLHSDPFTNSTSRLDFVVRKFLTAGGYYYTFSPYFAHVSATSHAQSAQASSRVGLVSASGYIANGYTFWGTGNRAAGSDDSFAQVRWKTAPATLTQPSINMTPDGQVTLNCDVASLLGIPPTSVRYYYTLDGTAPTTSSTLYSAGSLTLTEGQTLRAIAYYDGVTSPVADFTALKSAVPTFAVDNTGNLVMNCATGDTIVYTVNNAVNPNPEWNTEADGLHTFRYQEGHPAAVETGDIFIMRAFQRNQLQSDLVEYHHDNQLVVNVAYTAYDEACSNPSNTLPSVALTAKVGSGAAALNGYYTIYYTLDPNVSLDNLDTNNLPAGVQKYTSTLQGSTTFPCATANQVRAVAVSSGNFEFYRPSTVAVQSVIWGFDATSTLDCGSGTQADPYCIRSAADLMVLSLNTYYHNKSALYFQVKNDISIAGCGIGTIANFAGHFDGAYKVISGGTAPLFGQTNSAHIYNVVLDDVNIRGNQQIGALVNRADQQTRIWNCGVRATNGSEVNGDQSTGGLVGYLTVASRVINCYNFANVTSRSAEAGGLVGKLENASTVASPASMVFNCMNYGNVTARTYASPVYGGSIIDNAETSTTSGSAGAKLNTYTYYAYEASLSGNSGITYNATLAAEDRMLKRFEFYRGILNSNADKCNWWVGGSATDTNEASMGKWVLDKSIAEYPVLKRYKKGGYPSVINPDYAHASATANAYEGKKLGTLAVTINYGANGSAGAATNNTVISIPITDMDTNNYDYNYYKIQLPYYNDYFNGNYSTNVVTGWMVTSVTGGKTGHFSKSSTADDGYNFADRYDTQKDLYSVSGRVFAQGGYYNVPEGVTAITITAKWGKAVYLQDKYYDVTYYNPGTGLTPHPTQLYGTRGNGGRTVRNTLSAAIGDLGTSGTVYDQAIVLVGNYHSANETWDVSSKPFTLMSIDADNDHEPDYCLMHQHADRKAINPVRFDFLWHPGIGMAHKPTNANRVPNQGIFLCKGHFEITETCVAQYSEFEYDNSTSTSKNNTPFIANNGIFDQFVSSQYGTSTGTSYMQLGGHAYFVMFNQGCHPNNTTQTAHCPISVTGGEYEQFYLSGMFKPSAPAATTYPNPHFYANGGKFGTYASGGMEQINGNVTVKADHIIADEFYGGGINAAKPITGSIDVTINNSLVGIYAGGPKFGNMSAGKTVTTKAAGTTFGTYYGAGYGGSSLNKVNKYDNYNQETYNWGTLAGNYSRGTYDAGNGGTQVSYEYELFAWAGGNSNSKVARFYVMYASLSKANTNGVSNTLTRCTVNNDYYGAGFVGATNGAVTSVLDSTAIHGSVFGAGNSASVPTCQVLPAWTGPYPSFNGNTGLYTRPPLPAAVTYQWKHVDAYSGTNHLDNSALTIETTESLEGFGQVTGNVDLTIKGTSVIDGSVFGGGNASEMTGNTNVKILGKTLVWGNVYGAGNTADVNGNTSVQIGEAE